MKTREEYLQMRKEELVELIINLYATIDNMEDAHRAEVNGAYESGGISGYKDGYSEAEDRYR